MFYNVISFLFSLLLVGGGIWIIFFPLDDDIPFWAGILLILFGIYRHFSFRKRNNAFRNKQKNINQE